MRATRRSGSQRKTDIRPTRPQVEVSACGNTVWVNSHLDGSCIGRFSKRHGIDVHRTGTEQALGAGECLYCTHGPAGREEWDKFREAMLTHYGVNLPVDLIAW